MMKGISVIAGILALLFCVSVLSITSEAVLAQDHGWNHKGKDLFNNLTSEQRKAIQDKMAEMRSEGASREETHAAINELLKSYGIEVPNDSIGLPPGPGHFGQHEGGFWGKLTEEQKAAIQAKMKELRDNNASPEEMCTTIDEMLKSYGIEVPHDSLGPPFGYGCFEQGPGGFWGDLTKEQRQAIQAKTKEMRSQNATHDEIHTAVSEMLKGYGIDVPEDWPGPPPKRGDFGPGPRGFWKNLTEEQRVVVKNKIEEMREQGATREEIRAAVDEMIQGYGIKSPENSTSQISEKTPGENLITAGSYPNPFNPETQIAYTLGVSERVKIRIYNITGQLIRTFDQGYQPAGNYVVLWDGRNENGNTTASGVYLYRIEAGHYSITNRMVLLK
jgi:Spy/CpxP family protein refolding chaperone